MNMMYEVYIYVNGAEYSHLLVTAQNETEAKKNAIDYTEDELIDDGFTRDNATATVAAGSPFTAYRLDCI